LSKKHEPESARSVTINVLLIESRDSDVRYVREILSTANELFKQGPAYHLEVVGRLDKAFQRLAKGDIDVILTDLALPDSTGLDTFKKIDDYVPDLPVVIFSADDEKMAAEAVQVGAQDYLFKSKMNANNLPRILQYAFERKRIQRQVYQAEQRYRSVFENSAVAIILTDHHGAIVSWNSFTEKILGMNHDDLHLQSIQILYPAKEWEKIRFHEIQKKTDGRDRFETKMLRKDGTTIDGDVSISILKDPAGRQTGSITILRDITEQKRLEGLKDEFLSTVSHELRTPLAIIREAVSQIAEGILGKTNLQQKKFLDISLENIDRLTRIVNDLLDISKLEAGIMTLNREFIDIVAVVRKVCVSFEERARKKGVKLACSSDVSFVEIFADRDKIIQVMVNLIGNALKFTDKGKITVTLRNFPDRVECGIADTGRGIGENDLSGIFSKFQQFGRIIGPGDQGTGLGLSISKQIVELHKGNIWAESRSEEGSIFTFSLPKLAAEQTVMEKIGEKIGLAGSQKTSFSIIMASLNKGIRQKKKTEEQMDGKVLRFMESWAQHHLPKKNEIIFKGARAMIFYLPSTGKEDSLVVAGRVKQVAEDALAKWKIGDTLRLDFAVASFPDDGQTAGHLIDKLGILHPE
jgi:PAS domain S-box-containing protein